MPRFCLSLCQLGTRDRLRGWAHFLHHVQNRFFGRRQQLQGSRGSSHILLLGAGSQMSRLLSHRAPLQDQAHLRKNNSFKIAFLSSSRTSLGQTGRLRYFSLPTFCHHCWNLHFSDDDSTIFMVRSFHLTTHWVDSRIFLDIQISFVSFSFHSTPKFSKIMKLW